MSKSSCRFVVTKKDDCCYKTTTETVVGLYGVAVPAFPTSSTKDSVHVVRYDDALVTYAYNGTAWIETTNTPITSPVVPGVLGGYRQTGTPIGFPTAPYMGVEYTFWTPNLLYIGGFTENVATLRYLRISLTYVIA